MLPERNAQLAAIAVVIAQIAPLVGIATLIGLAAGCYVLAERIGPGSVGDLLSGLLLGGAVVCLLAAVAGLWTVWDASADRRREQDRSGQEMGGGG